VLFDNIKLHDSIITEPKEIRQHIKNHFANWTKHNPHNPALWEQWKNEYSPKTNILSTWYNTLTDPITQHEIISTINTSPNKKATGPTLISNEMLKHTHPHIIKLLTILFNKCLNTTEIPTAWKQSKIYPISKKPIFTGQLNHTRPITLLEHT